jgi:putative sterol carrier protein
MIHENWGKINALDGGQEFKEMNSAIFSLIAPPRNESVEADKAAEGSGSVADIFENMSKTFKADAAAGVDVVFQFIISGPGGGDWHSVIKDKTCTIDAGVHAKPVCTLKMADADFLAMMEGTLPAMQAYTSGKLKIEGDIMKSQLLEKLFTFGK